VVAPDDPLKKAFLIIAALIINANIATRVMMIISLAPLSSDVLEACPPFVAVVVVSSDKEKIEKTVRTTMQFQCGVPELFFYQASSRFC